MDGAERVWHLADFFESIEWWRLIPAPELLVTQPGNQAKRHFVTISKSAENDLIVAYVPEDREIALKSGQSAR